MKIAFARCLLHSGPAVGHGRVPLLLLIENPAAQVVRFRITRILREDGPQPLQCAVRAAEVQILAHRSRHAGRQRPQRCRSNKKTSGQQLSSQQVSSYWTTLMGTPSLSGCAFVVPNATTSPTFSPLTICTSVRFSAPTVTLTRCRVLPSLR